MSHDYVGPPCALQFHPSGTESLHTLKGSHLPKPSFLFNYQLIFIRWMALGNILIMSELQLGSVLEVIAPAFQSCGDEISWFLLNASVSRGGKMLRKTQLLDFSSQILKPHEIMDFIVFTKPGIVPSPQQLSNSLLMKLVFGMQIILAQT